MELYKKIQEFNNNFAESKKLLENLKENTKEEIIKDLTTKAAQNYLSNHINEVASAQIIQEKAQEAINKNLLEFAPTLQENAQASIKADIVKNTEDALKKAIDKTIAAQIGAIKSQIIDSSIKTLTKELQGEIEEKAQEQIIASLDVSKIAQDASQKSANDVRDAAFKIVREEVVKILNEKIHKEIEKKVEATLIAHINSKFSNEELREFVVKNTQDLFNDFVKNNTNLYAQLEYKYKSDLLLAGSVLGRNLAFLSDTLEHYARVRFIHEQRANANAQDNNMDLTYKTFKVI